MAGDIYEPTVQAKLKAVHAKCILCCNIFEHLADPETLARICDEILSPGGFVVITVPQSYPLHLDPIDTYYRPKPSAIASLFPGYRVLLSQTVVSGTAASDMENPWLEVPKIIRRAPLFCGVDATKARMHRLLWLFRHYRISVCILRKPAADGG